MTCTAIETVWVTPPPVAVMVMVFVPVGAFLLALMVKAEVPVPGAAMLLGLKETDSPRVVPEAERLMDELNGPLAAVVMVVEPDEPWVMLSEVVDGVSVKLAGAEEVTVSDTVVLCVTPPPVPVMV